MGPNLMDVFGTDISVRTLILCQWWPNAHTLSTSVWCRLVRSLFTLLRSCSKRSYLPCDSCNFFVLFFFETYTVWASMSTNSPIENSDKGRGKGGKALGVHFKEVCVRDELEPIPRSNEKNLLKLCYWCNLPTKCYSQRSVFNAKNLTMLRKREGHYNDYFYR